MVSILHSSLKFLHPRVPASYVFSAPSHFTQNHYGVDFAAPRPSLHQPGPRALPAAEAVKRIVCNYSACCSDLQPIIVIKLSKCCDSSSAGIGIQVKLYPLGRNYILLLIISLSLVMIQQACFLICACLFSQSFLFGFLILRGMLAERGPRASWKKTSRAAAKVDFLYFNR